MPEIPLKSKLAPSIQPSLKNLTNNFGELEAEQNQIIQNLTKPHVSSFDWFLTEGLSLAAQSINPAELMINNDKYCFKFSHARVNNPRVDDGFKNYTTTAVYPTECRQRGSTYSGKLTLEVSYTVNGKPMPTITHTVGPIPIMVKSACCNIAQMKPDQLVKYQEEAEEMGGYFIVNGNEKVIRLLIMQRRNYPLAIVRPSWLNRGKNFSEFGISIRSMSPDQSTAPTVLHYLKNGTVSVCMFYRKEMFFLPLMMVLKCLVNKTGVEIYQELVRTKKNDTYFVGCMKTMLRDLLTTELSSHTEYLAYIGEKFRIRLRLPEFYSDAQVGKYLFDNYLLIHLPDPLDKFRLMCYMTRKLFDVALGKSLPENPDSIQNQEVLLPGHLFTMYLKEKMELWLLRLKQLILKKCSTSLSASIITNKGVRIEPGFIEACVGKVPDVVSNAVSFMVATGNLDTKSGLGLMQFKGLSVVADKLNMMRYTSHFRCVHRGAFFAEMRTTGVRKLLPDSWGFLCPVHTPDGAPCGLMNHMSHLCEVVTHVKRDSALEDYLASNGMHQPDFEFPDDDETGFYPVLYDGKLIGWLPLEIAPQLTLDLRHLKAKGSQSSSLEICLIEASDKNTQHPGLYLFNELARLVRPVWNIVSGAVEMVGTFEQVYLNICVIEEEQHELTTHQELCQHSMLSFAGCLTPYSDFNQSPRNMYQCQMGKQTMGTAAQAIDYRADNKLYRLETPQAPLVRPYMYDHYQCDNFPSGTNAIVAVISYTGYDMEDAIIINKASFDRGFGYGSIFKTETIDLATKSGDRSVNVTFGVNPKDPRAAKLKLDEDGLPFPGQRLRQGDAYYSYVEHTANEMTIVRYKGAETAIVDSVRALGNNNGTAKYKRVSIVLRVQRNPIIGDKFASRHGQKGVCSQLWPDESMPFTEGGMRPDIIFNPHGFPSRMTIGMMIESMAGKAASMHGHCYDATPFNFNENHCAVDHFGKMLLEAGYNYHGTETMYSGTSGLELEANIFIGTIYYQRLRHMVSDKFQVRTTGPIDMVTQQPIGGRKRGGGVRFGEMERDALIAHGCATLLRDRLFESSDSTQAYLCEKCGSLLSPYLRNSKALDHKVKFSRQNWLCKTCDTSNHLCLVDIPFVYMYLINELAAVNIKTIVKA